VEEKMMKRILFALLAVMMVFGAALTTGCEKSADAPAEPATEQPAEGGAQG
jgi:ABC-type oligopeptide transport system substrate-binding subunit